MPVNTQHPEYKRLAPTWAKMRALAAGQKAVHDAGETFLPKLSGETADDYKARKARALFFNATWRTIEGLRGMIFRKPPKVEVGTAADDMLDDVTKDGTDIETFNKFLSGEILTVGRVGVLVDYPQVDVAGLTQQAVVAMNIRPHMAAYRAESIINWRETWLGNKTVLSQVVLTELATVNGKDEFEHETVERFRVLDLYAGDDGKTWPPIYRYRVIERTVDGGELVVEFGFPKMNGVPLPHIPFQIFNDSDLKATPSEPPLIDLANVNESHYHTSADLEHGAHKTALPQPWIAGINAQHDANGTPINPVFYMGGGEAWAFPSADTTVGMLEYTGAGLSALESRMTAKQQQMAVLGARMLEEQKREVETAEAASIHRSGEQSALASTASTQSRGMRNCLSWFDQWAGGVGEVVFELNRVFFAKGLTPEQLTAHIGAWQAGAISKEQLFDNLQAGEVVGDGTDFETEETKIANAPPTLPTPPATNDGNPDDQGGQQ